MNKFDRNIKEEKESEETLTEYLHYEKNRYKLKGYGLINAFLITSLFFYFSPILVSKIFHSFYDEKFNEGIFSLLWVCLWHEFLFIFINLIYCLIYNLRLSFFERYKSNDKPWPWEDEPEEWRKLLGKTIKLLLINHLIVLPLSQITYAVRGKSFLVVDPNINPSLFEILWQVTFFMFAEDLTFYMSHRLLHWDVIYPYIHKIHHQYKNTVSIASEYAHPIEFLFGNLATTSAGALILGNTHIITYTVWIILRIGETCDGHSGYEFSWSPYRLLPFSGSSEYHNFHHINYRGNYSSFFTIWDRLFGTVNKKYLKFHSIKNNQYSEKKNQIY